MDKFPDWQLIEMGGWEDGDPVLLFGKELIDPDNNPEGIVEGYYQEDEGWVAAVWCSCHDTWHREIVHPTHWMRRPPPPVV